MWLAQVGMNHDGWFRCSTPRNFVSAWGREVKIQRHVALEFNFFLVLHFLLFFPLFLVGGASRKGFNRFMPYSSPPRLLKPKLKIKNKK